MEATHHPPTAGSLKDWLFSRTGVATVICVAVLGFLVYEGHGLHLLGFLPWLLILACPLMHIFMHGGHHGGHHHDMKEGPIDPIKVPDSPESTPRDDRRANTQHKHEGH